jgi:hypothetical protein
MGKPDDTLSAIFAEPARANIPWRDIESLFKRLGARVSSGDGSRVRVAFETEEEVFRATFHRPHPQKEAHKSLVRSVRRFLEGAGFVP